MVARTVRDREVESSNLSAPTKTRTPATAGVLVFCLDGDSIVVVIRIPAQTQGVTQNDTDQDVRFGHRLNEIQDENGVDLGLLRANLKLSVEERLLALEEMIAFAESVGPSKRFP